MREEFRECDEVRTLGRSDISWPEADGGSFVVALGTAGALVDDCRASGTSDRAGALVKEASFFDLGVPAI